MTMAFTLFLALLFVVNWGALFLVIIPYLLIQPIAILSDAIVVVRLYKRHLLGVTPALLLVFLNAGMYTSIVYLILNCVKSPLL